MSEINYAEMLWPDRNAGPWMLTLHIAVVEGRPECIGYDVRAYRLLSDKLVPEHQDVLPLHWPLGSDFVLRGGFQGYEPGNRRDIKPLDSTASRVPLDRILRESMTRIETGYRQLASTDQGSGADELVNRAEAYKPERRKNRGGAPIQVDGSRCHEVANVYRKAYQERKPPRLAVADHFEISASTASNWLAKCRDLGYLPPTTQGTPRA